ncbi:MAG TPA: hypothetical protein VGR28_02125 [Candidatus Thermoplasmatota archaeon]|jgi:hypothetical protein|nr:hypothetical protein [Candidatus Thermoplasmatota archaeon]
MSQSVAVVGVLAMLLSVSAAGAPPPVLEPTAESHTPDPCLNPPAEPLCVPTPPAGSAACRAVGLVIRPVPALQQSDPTVAVTWPSASVQAEEHLLNLPILGSSAKAIDGYCSAEAQSQLQACGIADVDDLYIDLHSLAIPLLITADSLREEGCSDGLGGFNSATIANLLVKPDVGPAIGVPLAIGHTFVSLGPLGFVSVNEAYDQAGSCQRNTGSAVHVKLNVPIVDIYISWVSTVACRFPTTMSTTSVPTGGPFAAPATARDNAFLSSGGPALTGNVQFFLCAPGQVVAGVGCPAGGAAVGGAVPASGFVTSISTTTANFPGLYCWRAEYGGDAFHVPATHTDPSSECFQLKVVPTISTTSNPTGNTFPTVTTVDTATVSGPGGAPVPTGVINFVLCRPTEVTPTGCFAPNGVASGAPVLVGGVASSTPFGGAGTSAVGKYCWRVNYLGDANYFPAEHTNAGSECFTTVKQTPTITTQSNPSGNVLCCTTVTDRATVSGGAGQPTPTGTVQFFLCGSGSNSVIPNCATGGTLISTNTIAGGIATSAAVNMASQGPGWYCWRAAYSGDGVYNPLSHTNTTTECYNNIQPQ